jgi:hypothetical protein
MRPPRRDRNPPRVENQAIADRDRRDPRQRGDRERRACGEGNPEAASEPRCLHVGNARRSTIAALLAAPIYAESFRNDLEVVKRPPLRIPLGTLGKAQARSFGLGYTQRALCPYQQ